MASNYNPPADSQSRASSMTRTNPTRYYSGQFSAISTSDQDSDHQDRENYPLGARSPLDPKSTAPSRRASTLLASEYTIDKAAATYDYHNDAQSFRASESKPSWTRRRKCIVASSVVAVLVLALGLGLGLGLGLQHSTPYDYVPSSLQVTNASAFTDGGATRRDPANVTDGIGAGTDQYTYYSGPAENFPPVSSWVSFEDLWNGNQHSFHTSCKINYDAKENTAKEIASVYAAVQSRAAASLIDHRLILAVILQETAGCVRAGTTTSYSGVSNPGIMQTHNGHSWSSSHSNASIYAMIQDGTQGTMEGGSGLLQNLDLYGGAYRAARAYNSGLIPASGNLSEAAGATACYVSDLANRLTGWANATRGCVE